MPFVQRVVQPTSLSRVVLHDDQGRPRVKDGELEAVTNHTLSSALRQLASVVLLADEIFKDLGKILGDVGERSKRLRVRIAAVDERVSEFDPKAVTVPESDLTIFSNKKQHYKREQCVDKGLFTLDSRPVTLQRLYEAAAPTPLPVVRQLDRYRRDGLRSSRFFAVTPVMAGKRRHGRPTKANAITDIESSTPAVVSRLRMWTSLEALGDVTVDPDCTHKIDASCGIDDVDHRLPSPQEQVQAIALKFPAEIVKVDVTGRSFSRMSAFRRSLMHVECDDTRRSRKSRRSRSKRRNTIAGTDTKELAAIVCDSSDTNFGKSTPESTASVLISASEKKSHLESLKEWGRSRLRSIKNSEPAVRLRERSLSRRKWDKEKDEPHPHSSSGNWSASSESGQSTATSHHPRSSISSGSTCQKHGRRNVMQSTSSSVTSESTLTPDDGETCSMYSCDTEGYYTSFHMDSGLKTLREEDPMPALHSSSALSNSRLNSSSLTADSEYELFGKGSTSTTASSAGTVCTTLIIPPPSVPERVNSHLSSERNVKSLNNLSSDKTPPLSKENSSFKTDNKSNTDPCRGRSMMNDIKKVETVKSNLTKENVSKLKEQYKDNVSDDKNCMIMVEVHHEGEDGKNEKCGDSPDSGHNTCSSPVDSVTSPSLDLEMSECSDLEGVDRVERIRVKTTINSSRIPSMCVITPPQSDDEVSLSAIKAAVDIGDYVTIADVRHPVPAPPVPVSPVLTRDTEYVSLNELPSNDSLERKRRQGARVTLDSEGKVVYSSDSLRRRKAIHTTGTFDPGPNIATTSSPVMQHRVINIRPVITSNSPILRGDRRLASANLTPTTQKIISASQQIISRPLSPLVSTKKNVLSEPISTTPVTLLSKADTLKNVDNKALVSSNSQPNNSAGLVTVAPQRRTSPSNQKQYFPKSSYGCVSPVASSNRPMSPLAISNNPKITNISNGRRSQTPPTSPVKSPTLSARPLSPRNVVRANLNRAVSPTSPRGAYVRVRDSTSPDDDSKLVKRSDSYRMANDETKTVFNPNVLGRKQYGAGIVAGPKLLTAIQSVQTNKESKTKEEDSSAGNTSPPRQWQGTWPQRGQSDVRSSTPTKANTPPMNITSTLSPIRSATPQPTPTHSTRSPMDLYAIIHESKKRIMKLKGKQSPVEFEPAAGQQVNWPKAIPRDQLRSNLVLDQSQEQLKLPSNGQYQRLSHSPTPSPLYVDKHSGSAGSYANSAPGNRMPNSTPTKIENRGSPISQVTLHHPPSSHLPSSSAGFHINPAPGKLMPSSPPSRIENRGSPINQAPLVSPNRSPGFNLPSSSANLYKDPGNRNLNSPPSKIENSSSPINQAPMFSPNHPSSAGLFANAGNRKPSSPPSRIENNLNRGSPINRVPLFAPNQSPSSNLPNRNYSSLDRRFSPKGGNHRQQNQSSDRLGLSHSTSRNDFKQLLLRTGWGSSSPGKQSAVERLKNNKPQVPAVPSPKRKTWKSDVLSSTILEDCDEADGPSQVDNKVVSQTARNRPTSSDVVIPKSSALVSQQCKAFQARSSPTLETAL